ncbi:hypothetical protein [Paenisporosarcina sp. NPDC076898]|uniref:hypothetical protein n=1 Tax=unclassified Paenisporosarcina TaxID=2642018 RepID=UPI003CFC1EE6
MDDKQFDQQMKLLSKSYNRVPSKFNADDVLNKIDAENKNSQEVPAVHSVKQSKWQKVSVWTVSLASVFLIGILSASFLNDHEKQKSNTATEYNKTEIAELKKDYQKEREIRRKMLGMTSEQFDQLNFVQFADSELARITHPDTIKNSTLPLKVAYGETIKYLLLPSEMLTNLPNGNELNEEESMWFTEEFTKKIDDLVVVYNQVLADHKDVLSTAKMNGKLDVAYLNSKQKDLPEPVRQIILNSSHEGIMIEVAPNEKEYIAEFQMNDQIYSLYGRIAQRAIDALAFKQMAPFTNGGELVYGIQESASILDQLEIYLLSDKNPTATYTVIKSYYEDLAFTLIFGSPNTVTFENGKIKEEYQFAWNYLLRNTRVSPIKYYMTPVVASLRSNDWEVNETYKMLDFNGLKEAFQLAETGELAKVMPTDEMDFVDVVEWPNSDIQQKIHGYLKNSGTTNPDYALSNLTPIESVLLFSYAQQIDFPDLMLDLVRPFQGIATVSDIQTFLGNENILPNEAITLMYDDRMSSYQYEEIFGTIEVQQGGRTVKTISLMKNHREGVWQIDLGVTVSFEGEHFYEPINSQYTNNIQSIYEEFKKEYNYELINSEGPAVIAGIYLEALYSGDAETQYALLVDDEYYIKPTREEFLGDYVHSENVMDWKTQFDSVEYMIGDLQAEHDQVIYFNLKPEFQTNDESQKGFQLRKTVEGWRVHFMPMQ